MGLRDQLGKKSVRHSETVTSERLRKFAQAVGSSGPADVAPPTFLTAFRRGEFDLFEVLGIPLSSVLHAEQEYTYEIPIRAGDTVEFETELTKVLEKSGASGSMSFMTFKTDFFVKDRTVATSSTTIVVRR